MMGISNIWFGINFSQAQNSIVLAIWGLIIFLMWRSSIRRKIILRGLKLQESQKFSGAAFENPVNRPIKNILFILGLFFACVALLGPQWGQKEQVTKSQGLDICIALDISRSMLTEDLSPNRLKQAKNQLNLFLPRLGGDRVAVVGFAGSAFIASPLSVDYQSVLNFVEVVEPSFQSDHSTNIPIAIESCLSALGLEDVYDRNKITDDSSKVILFVSDGEDTVEDSNDSVKRAIKLGVSIHSMIVGTTKGGPIPLRDETGRTTSYLKDPETNQPAISTIQDKYLKSLAKDSGGEVYYLTNGPAAWTAFENEISGLKRDSRDAGKHVDKEERFQWPLILAFLLLLADFFLSETKLRFSFSVILLLIGTENFANAQDVESIYQNNRAINEYNREKKQATENHQRSQELFNEAIIADPSDPTLRYNWSTNKLWDAYENSKKKGQPDASVKNNEGIANQSIAELEKLKREASHATNKIANKKLLHQLGQSFEIKGDNNNALTAYYQSLMSKTDEGFQKIDEGSRTNISRLITQNSSGKGNSSSDKGKSGEKGEGESGDQDKEGNDQGKAPPPKDGEDAHQGKRKAKFSGSEISENQARQIMQSVSGEEQEVVKRKFESEAKERLKRSRQEGEDGKGGKPW